MCLPLDDENLPNDNNNFYFIFINYQLADFILYITVGELYQQSFLTYLKSMTSPSLVKMTASQILPIPGTSGAPLSSSTTTASGGGFSSVTSCRPARLAACLALACLRALA